MHGVTTGDATENQSDTVISRTKYVQIEQERFDCTRQIEGKPAGGRRLHKSLNWLSSEK